MSVHVCARAELYVYFLVALNGICFLCCFFVGCLAVGQ